MSESEYMIQGETLQGIADAIRDVNGRTATYTMAVSTYADEISKLDPPITQYSEIFENGYYGIRAAEVAETYLFARIMGTDKFAYRTTNIFSVSSTPYVRTGEYGRIDCSAFIGLVLRGITYENSPYAKHTASDSTWSPSSELAGMYGTDGWEFKELDRQKAGLFNNIGISGYSTIRFAADLGQYFYKHGYRIWDKSQGTLSAMPDTLRPGDLVFWDTSSSAAVDGRFMSISHVGIVAEDTSRFFQATGSESAVGQDVILYSYFKGNAALPIGSIVLIARPDYRPHKPKAETPLNTNLLGYPWTYSNAKTFTLNGITYTLKDMHTLVANGTATSSGTLNLKGNPNSTDYITLSPGTYKLSGINGTETTFCLQVKNLDGSDFSTRVRNPTDSSSVDTFTITAETKIIVCVRTTLGKILTNETFTPTLVRIS